eukprot:COSAG04_NODE_3_length_53939_cov_50.145431_1_plen_228_part_00
MMTIARCVHSPTSVQFSAPYAWLASVSSELMPPKTIAMPVTETQTFPIATAPSSRAPSWPMRIIVICCVIDLQSADMQVGQAMAHMPGSSEQIPPSPTISPPLGRLPDFLRPPLIAGGFALPLRLPRRHFSSSAGEEERGRGAGEAEREKRSAAPPRASSPALFERCSRRSADSDTPLRPIGSASSRSVEPGREPQLPHAQPTSKPISYEIYAQGSLTTIQQPQRQA